MNHVFIERDHFLLQFEGTLRLSCSYCIEKIPKSYDENRLVFVRRFQRISSWSVNN